MGKCYLTCPRCDKDLELNSMFDAFSSAIDFKIICRECWEKEQPKEMFKQIKILEKALELVYEEYKQDSTPAKWIYHITKEEYVEHIKIKAKEMIKSE